MSPASHMEVAVDSEVEAIKALIENIVKQNLKWEYRESTFSNYWITHVLLRQPTVNLIVVGLDLLGIKNHVRELFEEPHFTSIELEVLSKTRNPGNQPKVWFV